MRQRISTLGMRRLGQAAALGLLLLLVARAAVKFGAHPLLLVAAVSLGLYALFALASFRQPTVFVVPFLVILILLPPFYFQKFGTMPIYISSLLVPIAAGVVVVRLPDFDYRLDSVGRGLCFFLLTLGLSLPFAFWLSGSKIAIQSLLRWLLMGQSILIYFLVRRSPRMGHSRLEHWVVPVLLIAAVVSAAYGIFDFFWPVALPHPAANQFVWLENAIIRRAQGVFYEASEFANMCGFFLLIVSAAFLAKKERAVKMARPLLPVFVGVLSVGLFVSFYRSAWVSTLVAIVTFAIISKQVKLRRALAFLVVSTIPLIIFWYYTPDLWNYLMTYRVGYLADILANPNLASSGRFDTWLRVLSILETHPMYLVFGVGYKTLPFTRLFHAPIITDNGFLSLLLATGILGLTGFVVLSATIFKKFFSLARQGKDATAFWGAVFFSFWCGEWVQMMASDAYTYWRNMVVILGLMAFILNRCERKSEQTSRFLAAPI